MPRADAGAGDEVASAAVKGVAEVASTVALGEAAWWRSRVWPS